MRLKLTLGNVVREYEGTWDELVRFRFFDAWMDNSSCGPEPDNKFMRDLEDAHLRDRLIERQANEEQELEPIRENGEIQIMGEDLEFSMAAEDAERLKELLREQSKCEPAQSIAIWRTT